MRITSTGLLLAALSISACGASHPADGTGAVAGRRAFDVVATLSTPNGQPLGESPLPKTSTFTLVLDPEAHDAIVGGMGTAATVGATSADGRTFVIAGFSVGLGTGDGCSAGQGINFDMLTITVSGSTLHGTASGSGYLAVGDELTNVPFSAELTGVADATPPFLVETRPFAASPFASVSAVSNEPLPATAKAWLTTVAGAHLDLTPVMNDDKSMVVGFSGPGGVLPSGDVFSVALEGLVDFAGQRGTSGMALQLPGFAAPPVVPEDGFESATGAQLGGAVIITGVGDLKPIAGARSVYFGAAGVPVPPEGRFSSALRVRLALEPGDTKLRFSYRTVSITPGYAARVAIGSVGHVAKLFDGISSIADGTPISLPAGPATLGAVKTMEVALPADVTDEVIVEFDTSVLLCGGFTVPPQSGLLVDDLRVE